MDEKFAKELELLDLVVNGISLFDNGITSFIKEAGLYLGKNISKKIFPLPKKLIEYLNSLQYKDANEIEELLPKLFAADLDEYNNKKRVKKIVIIVDTYEELWSNKDRKYNSCNPDKWLREIAVNLDAPYLFVIFTREPIIWDKCQFRGKIEQKELSGLSDKEAEEFLESYSIREEDIKKQIIKNAQGLPLYLYLDVQTYLRLEKPTVKDFEQSTKQEILERFVKHLNNEERELLNLLSHPISFDKELANALIEKFLKENYIDKLNVFLQLSFIKYENEEFKIHKLVREHILKSQLKEYNDKVEEFLFDYYQNFFKDLELEDFKNQNKEKFNEYLYRAYYHKKNYTSILEQIKWINGIFKKIYDAGYYDELLKIHKDLSKNISEKDVKNADEIVLFYNNFAWLYETIGEYDKPQELYKKALKLGENILGKEHIYTLMTYNNLALLYKTIGKYKKALDLYTKTLKITQKIVGEDNLDIALICNNIATLYIAMGEYEKAKKFMQKSVNINEKILGEEHIDMAISYNNLGQLYKSLGEYDKALELSKKSLKIREKILGKDHPKTAKNYNNLGELYNLMGEYDKAKENYEKALKIKKKVFGEEHPDTATIYNNLGTLYVTIGELEKAKIFLQKAVNIMKKTLPDDNPYLNKILENLETIKNFDIYKNILNKRR
jgi:tetratricopeptide (TPR) repeat protein